MSAWSLTTLPSALSWSGITYGNGKFVAVSSAVAYSTDGVNWTGSTFPYSYASANSIAFGNGRFVAVGNGSYYSTDGINWNTMSPSITTFHGVSYGNGKFVAIHGPFDDSKIAYSTDGTTWTSIDSPIDRLVSIAYGNNVFVAVSSDSSQNYIILSTDGINWTKMYFGASDADRVRYVGDKFIVIYRNRLSAKYSYDGITWNNSDVSADYWADVAYGNGTYVLVSSSSSKSNKVAYSADGINWVASTLPQYAEWETVAYGSGKFVTIDSNNTGLAAYISEDSEDLIVNATIVTIAIPETGGSVIGGGTYVKGKSATIKATPSSGYEFVCWKEGDAIISTYASYTFTVSKSRNFTAVFKQKLTLWIGVDGKARRASALYVGVGGKARKVTAAYIGVNGKARRFL